MLVKKHNKKFLLRAASLGIFIFLGAVFLLGNVNLSLAATADELAWNGQQAQFEQQTGLSSTNPVIVVTRIIQIFLGFLGFIAVILIIYAGFLWMTSAGDADKVKKAKDILKNAFIGLIIILSSVGIVTFILNMLINDNGSGSGNGAGGGPGNVPPGTGAIGNCAIVDYYPAANQREVPRNSVVLVTFREAFKFDTVADNNLDINTSNVKLFNKCNDTCQVSTGKGCDACLVEATATSTDDNKTLVIMPKAYLGSPTENVNYYMVMNNGIQNNKGKGIFGNCTPDSAAWSFEVNTMLDLDPPQVLKRDQGGVFPLPDSQKDVPLTNTAAKAVGGITVNDINVKTLVKASIASVVKNPANAGWGNIDKNLSNINNGCQASQIKIGVNAALTATLKVGTANAGVGKISDDKKVFNFDYCDLKIVLENDKNFLTECGTGGCVWDMSITPYQEPDYLMIGSYQYIFVNSGTNSNEIALGANLLTKNSIAAAIASKNYSDVTATVLANIVTLTAQKAGNVGNGISISVSNPNLFTVTAMYGGADLNDNVDVKGVRDEPRNAIIKMNYNDQMLPINVSGEATVNSSIFVQCVNAGNCNDANYFFDCNAGNKCVKGKFKISNQYKTVEFQSNNECGVNSCGEKIYCLPANTELHVGMKAATLAVCASDGDCTSKNPFNKCVGGHCQDVTLGKNYPLANTSFDGLMDKARNSLDGNRNALAIGPVAFYNENTTLGLGDSFEWLFFITDKIDLTPPKVVSTLPAGGGAPIAEPVKMSFSKIMMSSSLIPGYVMIPDMSNNDNEMKHKTLNIWAKSGFPIGYWVTSEDSYDAMQIGRTNVNINHSDFDDYNNYRAQSGSGIKDIYQNCFKPSDKVSPNCTANGKPSCCNGVATDALNNEGNCAN
ncbi:Ig-like domain-containing protein [Candidatus Parcubacteria bacterium]|nr:Ig-like domain-containing protein [Patescibacteria group bacterium]MBU4309934.1 Ig-like domain-containing protein [Patescibacteria group bacterium]MBU4432672.1 Ig-like domain-containing protein [Patescibacteria group bacterium]MBU4577859.1 Ig-like domain-containing protein [Patescibacteria group bacterium]MCG2696920.1 Ig-like domain-containing protein [Candidatus Parcubacteria bacterium]